jgi:predicted HicB family RNase H-like nuclease
VATIKYGFEGQDDMVQLNVRITKELKRKLKLRAAEQGIDLKLLINQLVKQYLGEE